MKQLYPFQSALVAQVRAHIRAGVQRVGLWSATGTGKTEMAIALARSTLDRGGCVLFLVDRIDLVTQNQERWAAEGIDVGAVCGSLEQPDWTRGTLIATWQTLATNEIELAAWAARHRSCLVFVDEAHDVAWPEWVRGTLLPGQWSSVPVRFILLTATPWRMEKSQGMLDLLDVVVEGPTPAQAVREGFLCLDEPVALPWEGVERLKRDRGKDYSEADQEAVALRPAALQAVVDGLQQYGAGRATLGYAVSVRHGEALRDACIAVGMPSLLVEAKTSASARKASWEALAVGSHIVWNVGIAVKGLDVKPISRVVVARAIGSRAWWFQAVGRGMRRLAGKLECVVIDHGGNLARFGPSHALETWGAVKGQTADEKALNDALEALEALETASAADVEKAAKLWRSWCGHQWPTKIRVCPKCGEPRPPAGEAVTIGWPCDGKLCVVGMRFRNVKALCVRVGKPWLGNPVYGEVMHVTCTWRVKHPLQRGWYTVIGSMEAEAAPQVQQRGLLDGTVQPETPEKKKVRDGWGKTITDINRVKWEGKTDDV